MQNIDKIFLGSTKSDQRRFIYDLLVAGRKKWGKIIIPACGHFVMAKAAVQAGFEKSSIFNSDISLFSSLLGYYFSGRPVSELNFAVGDNHLEEYESFKNDTERIAFLFWLMKVLQIKGDNYYEQSHKEHIENQKVEYVKMVKKELKSLKSYFEGVNYEVYDLRKAATDEYEENTIVLLNPPVFSKGYSKMFDFEEDIVWDPGIEEFSWSKEYWDLFEKSKLNQGFFVWYRHKNKEKADSENVVFAKQYSLQKTDYWLVNKPETFNELNISKRVIPIKVKKCKPYKAPIVPSDYTITEKTKISFVKVEKEVGLYYRDLWAHRLGHTQAEQYFLMLLDGYVFGTVGFHLADYLRMVSDMVFENYGFSAPLDKYPTRNRFLMMCITCEEFRDYLLSTITKKNRIQEMLGFKTTCLTKYRKAKQNNNLLKIQSREKMPNGMYKIVYVTEWWQRNWLKCIKDYVTECKKGKKLK
jgi:hypothetical protein